MKHIEKCQKYVPIYLHVASIAVCDNMRISSFLHGKCAISASDE
jgi:hypothetical protein